MRISDWSSDVCSSDLPAAVRGPAARTPPAVGPHARPPAAAVDLAADRTRRAAAVRRPAPDLLRARGLRPVQRPDPRRSEEHTSELQSLMRISYAVFCLKKKKTYDEQRQYERLHRCHSYVYIIVTHTE